MRILASADLHITCLKKLLKEESYYRSEKALLELSDIIWDYEPDTILLSGDIFNSPYPSRDEIFLFTNFLLPLLKEEINVLMIPGNHESDREGGKTAINFLQPFDEAIENFHIAIDKFRPITIKGITFLMWPWGVLPNKKDLKQLDNVKENRIGMSHITLSGTKISKDNALLNSGYAISSLKEAIELFNLDYMFLGDIHEYQKVLPNAFYSGALYQTKFNESISKGVLLLDTEEGVSFQELINVPKLLNITESELESITKKDFYTLNVSSKEEFFNLSNATLPSNVVRIDYPFGKSKAVGEVVDSNRKVGYSISLISVMLKVLKKQGVKDLRGVMKYLITMVDSEKDLTLP